MPLFKRITIILFVVSLITPQITIAAPLPATQNIVVNDKRDICSVDDELPGDECCDYPLKDDWKIAQQRPVGESLTDSQARQICNELGYDYEKDSEVRGRECDPTELAKSNSSVCDDRQGSAKKQAGQSSDYPELLNQILVLLQSLLANLK
jgi:hypothetical protein